MADFETRVRVTGKVSGFEKLPQEASKMAASQKQLTLGFQQANKAAAAFQATVDKALKGFQFRKAKTEVAGLTEMISDLEEQLSDTAIRQLELQRAILDTEKGTEVYKHLTDEMAALDDEAARVQKTITLVNRAFKDQARATREAADAARSARGAFTQGFAQGAGVGEYMQRGPGAWRQAAGRMAGRAMVGVPGGIAKGLASTPFSGVGGVMAALQSNPITGMLAAPLAAGYGYAGQSIEYQKQLLGESPFLLGGAGARKIGAARAGGIRTAASTEETWAARAGGKAGLAARLDPKMIQQELDAMVTVQTNRRLRSEGRTGLSETEMKWAKQDTLRGMGGSEAARRKARDEAVRVMSDAAEGGARKDFGARRTRMGERAAQRAQRDLLSPITKAGRELGGMTPQEALSFAGSVARQGGGDMVDLQRTGLLRTGVAAQTAYGVGADVTGTMLGAARRGGVMGGAGGDQMAQMIGDAVSLGLKGSEITEYMQSMAEGIDQWKQTGIPLNPDAVRDMATVFASGGTGIVQGQRMAKGLEARAESIGVGGPQDQMDMIMLQELGGFKGGGIAELQEARGKLSNKDFKAPQIQSLMKRMATIGGKGKRGEAVIQAMLNQLGITATPQFAAQIQAMGGGTEMGPDQKRAARQFEREMREGKATAPKGKKGLEDQAAEAVPGILKQQAGLAAEQLGVGGKLASSMLNFEAATTKVAGGISNFGGELDVLAKKAKEAGTWLAAMSGKAKEKLGSGGNSDVVAEGG
jgi:hypothetical protein